jgi:MutS domain V
VNDFSSPAQEYSQRTRAREERVAQYKATHIRLGNARLALAVLAIVLVWLSLLRHTISFWWLAVPLAAFVAVAACHTKVLRQLASAERAVIFYRNGMARVEDRWSGLGETGERFHDPHHPYAADLDLFGKGSLFELLSAARTRIGEETLAQWLLNPAPLHSILDRQNAIAELRSLLDFREDLVVAGEDARTGVHPSDLKNWAESPPQFRSSLLPIVAPTLAVMAVAGVVVWFAWGTLWPLVAVLAIEKGIIYSLRKQLDEVLHKTEHAFEDLALLSTLVARIEVEPVQAPLLKSLKKTFFLNSNPASHAIDRLRRITDRIQSRHNMFLRIFDVPLMISVRVALAAEAWREEHGTRIRQWLASLGEIEALVSMATYSYEHPVDPFPEFVSGVASFASEKLGHPLIPAAVCVRNDVTIGPQPSVLLISGSNMSGKSTLLRTVGINVVLAMAGAPVRARRLQLTPLHTGASIRVNDSLQEGSSRFYAEITRLRQIFDLTAGEFPVLFLLDEVLQGTNSSDRRVGTEGIVAAFLKRAAIGLLSTHDLALTEVGGNIPGALQNFHFQDELKDGRMSFDYILRLGVVAKSNGLELMRSIGLDV